MVAWCRSDIKCVHINKYIYIYIYIYVSEDLAAEYLGVIVIMNNYGHRIVHKLIIRLHRVAV